jgi:lipopolysaccharide transport system ATP-binding protein
LVDEVLAVGDQKFQQKCLGKLGDVSADGRTVLFVSHNLASVAQLCSKSLVLDKGKVVFQGDVLDGISVYNGQMKDSPMLSKQDYLGNLVESVQFSKISLNDSEFQEGQEVDPLQDLMVKIEGQCSIAMDGYRSVFSVRKNGQLLFSLYDCTGLTELPVGRFESHFRVPAKFLLPGEYTCSFGGISETLDGWLWTRDYRFNVAHRWAEDYDSTSTVIGMVNVGLTGNRVIRG